MEAAKREAEKPDVQYETEIAELNRHISWLEDTNECLRSQVNKKETDLMWHKGFYEAMCMVFGGKNNG